MANFMYIYDRSPILIQNAITTLYGIHLYFSRYGGKFEQYYQNSIENQWLSLTELEALQMERLQAVLNHAYLHVPYYHKLFVNHGLKPQDITAHSDLKKLPYLEKEMVRQYSRQMVATNIPQRKIQRHRTSGTTGTPLYFYSEKELWRKNYAFHEARSRNWAGVSIRDKRAMIGGKLVVPITQKQPPFWRYNLAEKQIYLSSSHLSEENIPHYVNALLAFKPDYLTGYTSAIFVIASVIKKLGLYRPHLKAVIVSGEKLHSNHRDVIEDVFQTRVYDQWGSGERVGFASECEKGSLHISPDYGLIEILKDDKPVEPGEMGEMVCTGLLDFGMPFIRYRIGDMAIPSSRQCSCGRELPVLEEIIGKINDLLITPEGLYVPLISGNAFPYTDNVKKGQIIQVDIDQLLVKIVPSRDFDEKNRNDLLDAFKKILGTNMKIEIQEVDDIPRTSGGKFRGVINHVLYKSSQHEDLGNKTNGYL